MAFHGPGPVVALASVFSVGTAPSTVHSSDHQTARMQSLAATRLKPGTRVWVEGPYGVFTRHARRGGRVVLIGAGVGISPIRACSKTCRSTLTSP